jgi:hypothetical protein
MVVEGEGSGAASHAAVTCRIETRHGAPGGGKFASRDETRAGRYL